MIGFLSGFIKYQIPGEIFLDVHDVGYRISVPTRLTYDKTKKTDFYIHTHVREDDISLYGFTTEIDLHFFEFLLTVSGIGPRSALAVLSAASATEIRQAINQSNLNFFTAITGIGKKGAQRIILELRPKIAKSDVDLQALESNPALFDTLKNLGFKQAEIQGVLSLVNPLDPLPDQIKQALKLIKS